MKGNRRAVDATWDKSLGLVERIIIRGNLVLETPTQLGNGDQDSLIDMPLLMDPLNRKKALLTGASVAGALRSYLRVWTHGYRESEKEHSAPESLFGFQRKTDHEDDPGTQSRLITHDALSTHFQSELRDGVSIDPKTRLAEDQKKYDISLLATGTTFQLRFELLIPQGKGDALRQYLAIALRGLENGEIPLGGQKHRGFGRCRVQEWTVCHYDLTTPAGLIAWLDSHDDEDKGTLKSGSDIADLLDVAEMLPDRRSLFKLDATFSLDSSLLIRSGFGDPKNPDVVHLHSRPLGKEEDKADAILSGTSLGGALRSRALRIAQTLGGHESKKALDLIDGLFGPRMKDHTVKPRASRLWVDETVIRDPLERVIQRTKIDRFTGGPYPTALFSQQPIWGQTDTEVDVRLMVENPTPADMGLLLLLLKDLWTKDLPLGGEISVGRGRLKGKSALLTYQVPGQERVEWSIEQNDSGLQVTGDREALEGAVRALGEEFENGTE